MGWEKVRKEVKGEAREGEREDEREEMEEVASFAWRGGEKERAG